MDTCPDTSLLQSLRNASLTWPIALGELIDNSLDAGATQVRVHFKGKNELLVIDNGHGCDDLSAMLTLGRHRKHKATSLGRYGVGLKDASLWMWGALRLESTSRGRYRMCEIDWERICRSGSWTIVDPIETPAHGDNGTVLHFRGIERLIPRDMNRLTDKLSETFTPALLDGKQIVFERNKGATITLKPVVLPPLEHVVNDTFEIRGKGVRLMAGIVKDGHRNTAYGFSYYHGHRCLVRNCLGAGTYDVSRVCGQVYLDRKWDLTKNKDGISQGEEELAEAVYTRCRNMLETAHRLATTLESEAMNREIQDRIAAATEALTEKSVKGRRPNKAGVVGTVEPVGSGAEHRIFKYTQAGNKSAGRSARPKGCLVQWDDFNGPEPFGRYDILGNRVHLNNGNELLLRLRQERNMDALTLICTLLVAEGYYLNRNKQQPLPGFEDEQEQVTVSSLWARYSKTARQESREPQQALATA